MTTGLCGFVIRVRNLDECRTFYRDILHLGAPISDSSFQTEFQIAPSVKLILVKARNEEVFSREGNSALLLETNDLTMQTDILASFGYLEEPDKLFFLRPDAKCFHDPEGNTFYLVENKKTCHTQNGAAQQEYL